MAIVSSILKALLVPAVHTLIAWSSCMHYVFGHTRPGRSATWISAITGMADLSTCKMALLHFVAHLASVGLLNQLGCIDVQYTIRRS